MIAHEFHRRFFKNLFSHSCSLANREYNGVKINFQIVDLSFGSFDAFWSDARRCARLLGAALPCALSPRQYEVSVDKAPAKTYHYFMFQLAYKLYFCKLCVIC